MSLGLLFWVLVIVNILFNLYMHRNNYWQMAYVTSLLFLIILLGWQVFGPALHR